MTALTTDPDFSAVLASLESPPQIPELKTVYDYRAFAEESLSSILNYPVPSNIIETKHIIKSNDGAEITIYRFMTDDVAKATTPQPALLHIHGGGMVSCSIDRHYRPAIASFVSRSGVQAFSVEYRLAPEFPYPTPIEDCYSALQWVIDQGETINVDPTRIGLYGDSGGGCIAAGLSLLARDRQLFPPIAKQVLVYPMLDDRSSSHFDPNSRRDQSLYKERGLTDLCWDGYLGAGKRGRHAGVSEYASPARAHSFAGLPSTYIDIGSMDSSRDESLDFAKRLALADVDVELHLYSGVPHLFDLVAPDIPITKNAWENRIRTVRNIQSRE